MDKVIIRKASLLDVKSIQNIHRDCDDPWNNYDECKAWIERRTERGFYITVAQIDDKLVGHGEWIVSVEPANRYLYLGMLQIDSAFQHLGIGRKMISDGIQYAKMNNCPKIVTIPDSDNSSILFYEKCGFVKGRTIYKTKIPTCYTEYNYDILDSIPDNVVSKQRFVFGLSQVSSRHMWEVVNRKPKSDDRLTPAIMLNDGSCIQLSYFAGDDTGQVLCWSNSPTEEIIKGALSLGYLQGLKYLNFIMFDEYRQLFSTTEFTENDIEVVMAL